ncbi:hypothetical protein M8818_002613 [Zalaria obscura]|uniref:Uncharacterized protein n=1 Tax=Zalaria obscura TaxID=2024903 RepID=A0ACC3SIB9_9PEZI
MRQQLGYKCVLWVVELEEYGAVYVNTGVGYRSIQRERLGGLKRQALSLRRPTAEQCSGQQSKWLGWTGCCHNVPDPLIVAGACPTAKSGDLEWRSAPDFLRETSSWA